MKRIFLFIDRLGTQGLLAITLLWAAFITLVSCLPGHEIPESKLLEYDKLGHFGVYAILSVFILCWKWKQYSESLEGLNQYIWPLIFGVILGIILELLQGYVLAGRYFDMKDVIANIIGSIVGAVFALWMLNNKNHEIIKRR